MRARHRALGTVIASLAVVGTVLTLPVTAAAEQGGDDPAPLGSHLPEEVAEHVAEDSSLHVAEDGLVFARDEWHLPAGTAPADDQHGDAGGEPVRAASLAYSTTDTFALHSRSGAARTIYLDFDGGSLSEDNAWRTEGGGLVGSEVEPLVDDHGNLLYPGWSLDSDAGFSSTEQTVIREVWARVAEDFAPFDVDVTTEEPATGGLFRSSSSDPTYGARVAFTAGVVHEVLCDASCGGVAWIGTFDDVTAEETRSPAWVFPSALADKAKYVAEATSHEVGHNLGLYHDGTETSPYYSGNSLWGPIMGSPYHSRITQWSRGDYVGANNTQDDLATITRTGLPLRADDAGQGPATASPLSGGAATGVVTSRADHDWYAVGDCTGTVTATATPAAIGPNLDIELELRGSAGEVLASSAPATTATSPDLSASITAPLTGGPYYFTVSGAGSGAGGVTGWSTGGYDDYGSVGAYQLRVGGCGAAGPSSPTATPAPTQVHPPGSPGRPKVWRGARGGLLTVGVRWKPPSRTGGAAVTRYRLAAQRRDGFGRVIAKRTRKASASTRKTSLRLPRGRWTVTVQARNRTGWGTPSRSSAQVSPR